MDTIPLSLRMIWYRHIQVIFIDGCFKDFARIPREDTQNFHKLPQTPKKKEIPS